MKLKQNILAVLLILANFNKSYFTSGLKPYETNLNVTAVVQVLHDIAIEFLVNEKLRFNVLFLKKVPIILDIIDGFVALLKQKTSYRLLVFGKYDQKFKNLLVYAQIIFMSSLDEFAEIERFFLAMRFAGQPIKVFIIVPDLTFEMLRSSWIFGKYQQISTDSDGIFHSSYFITTEMDTVTLSSIESFEPAACGYPNLKILNTFNKTTSKWTTNVHGITPKIFEIASKVHNFTEQYQPVDIHPLWIFPEKNKQMNFVLINNTYKIPSVYFEIHDIKKKNVIMDVSNVIVNMKTIMFVTPADKYTVYEKFVLPFDSLTWILLGTTFMLTFMSIMMINLTSRATRNLVYGYKVTNPIWNVISIFFGISQTKLPTKNFSRFILVLFIFFCLIFRTCFQSKFFEFMTSEPRLSPPRTISDLIYRNYSVCRSMHQKDVCSRLEPWPKITNMSVKEISDAILTQSQNSSAKIALCVDEFLLNLLEFHTQKNFKWNKLETVFHTTSEAFMFRSFSFFYRMFKKVINNLIPTGMIEHLVTEFYTKKRKFVKIEDERKVLSVNDLLFGFKIWFGCCLSAGFAFWFEMLTTRAVRCKKIKFAKVYVTQNYEFGQKVLSSELIMKFRVKTKGN
ncbi:unnamed protein product [Chironomus riparius]|uniref:Ionotropic glutamate receptor C-terminal domain-containing protein n=1 Tax=Chironomus riparius TaxID=315576 RepID=A0A9N9S3R6_9DIPT|nr:unnamed protein product [Chironomus riparius]